ncbi:MAG: deoxyribonuclease IV [Desulfuromonadales bacterium]|nr:deoxyribonuclease IV [Desulfuromonadales bacterium]
MLLGVHVSIAGGFDKAVERGTALGCSAIQIFTKNASQWRSKAITEAEAEAFKTVLAHSPIETVIAHDSYLINLAAPPGENRDKSITAFVDEMERCATLGVPYLVMHPGAHLGAGVEVGLERISAAFTEIFQTAPPGVTVLLENTAGQGTYLGSRFEELAEIIARTPSGRFGICFDTCHAFAAGYDIAEASGYAAVMSDFERILGLDKLQLFHLNDSRKGLASHVDRHEGIGSGALGLEAFRAVMTDPRFAMVPKILETPKGVDEISGDVANLAILRRLAGKV